MTTAQTLEKAKQFIAVLHELEQGNTADTNRMTTLFASDATLTNSALESSGHKIQGTEEIQRFWTEYKEELGQVKSDFHHITTDDNSAGLFWTTDGTNLHGDTVHYHGATLLEFNEDGLISFFRGYYDPAELRIKAVA